MTLHFIIFYALLLPGNIDLQDRPCVSMPNESLSSVLSVGVEFDGWEVLIPTIVNGRALSEEEAVEHHLSTGEHLGKFRVPEMARRYAARVSDLRAEYGCSNRPG